MDPRINIVHRSFMKDFADTIVRVRYAETDQMGVAHHSNHLIWFEAGRVDYCRQLGFEYCRTAGRNLRRHTHRRATQPCINHQERQSRERFRRRIRWNERPRAGRERDRSLNGALGVVM